MTWREAADWADAMRGRDAIIADPQLGLLEQSKRLAEWSMLAEKPLPSSGRTWTFGDVVHGAIGAAMGAGMAHGISKLLNLNPRLADKLETASMGVGAAMNTGVIKWAAATRRERLEKMAQDDGRLQRLQTMRKHAFRVGALRALSEQGYFGQQLKEAMVIPTLNLSPTALLEIPRGLAQATTGGGTIAGTAVGIGVTPDEDEEEIANLQAERAMIEERIERLRAEQRNEVMRRLLQRRQKDVS